MIKIIFLLLILGGCTEKPSTLALKKHKPKIGTTTHLLASTQTTDVGTSTETTQIKWHSFDEGIKRAKEEKRAIMLYFTAPWCIWCKKLEREVFTNRELCEEIKFLVCIKVNVNEDKKRAFMYQIKGIPTILFLDANEEVKGTIVGFRSPKALLTEIRNLR